MTSSRFQLIERLFTAAVLAVERRPFLDAACDELELRGEVEKLLAVLDSDTRPRGEQVQEVAGELRTLAVPDLAGKELGPYRILRLIGSSGIGAAGCPQGAISVRYHS